MTEQKNASIPLYTKIVTYSSAVLVVGMMGAATYIAQLSAGITADLMARTRRVAECHFGDRNVPTTNEEIGRVLDYADITPESGSPYHNPENRKFLKDMLSRYSLEDCP